MLGMRGGDAGMTQALHPVRLIKNAIVLSVLAALAYGAWGFLSAEQRLRALCPLMTPGISMDDLRQFAAAHGLNAPRSTSGVTFMVERRTFGRYGCRLEMADGRLLSASYNFAD